MSERFSIFNFQFSTPNCYHTPNWQQNAIAHDGQPRCPSIGLSYSLLRRVDDSELGDEKKLGISPVSAFSCGARSPDRTDSRYFPTSCLVFVGSGGLGKKSVAPTNWARVRSSLVSLLVRIIIGVFANTGVLRKKLHTL